MLFSPETYRVLLVEDNPADAARQRELLAWDGGKSERSFQLVRWETRLARALEWIATSKPDLVLLDLTLPECTGIEAFLKLHDVAPHLPVIVLSDLDDEDTALRIVQEGAQDYVIKSELTARTLQRAMRYAMERDKVDRDLARKTEFLAALLEATPDRIYFKDSEGRYLGINHALADFFGLQTPEEAIGKSDFDFFAPATAERKLADDRHIMETGEQIADRLERETRPDGSRIWLLTTKMPRRDRTGRIVGTFGVSRDITVLKEMEDVLQRERNLLRSVIDNVPDFIQAKDPSGRYILNNLAHVRLLEQSSPGDVLGKSVFDFFPRELAEQYHKDDMAVLESREPIINKVEPTLDLDGSKRWISTTKVPIIDSDGEAAGLAIIARDIT